MSRKLIPQPCPLALALLAVLSPPARADEPAAPPVTLPSVKVAGERPLPENAGGDSSRLLLSEPGYFSAAGGGVSGLPVVNGLSDDRIKINLDGMDVTAACGNHMNAPLSYVSPSLIGSIRLHGGVTPVSLGGDNIGGVIVVKSAPQVFSESSETLRKEGSLQLAGRSVDRSVSTAVSASVASETLSLAYAGSRDQAQSYRDGNGDKVLGSLYKSENHKLGLAWRDESGGLLTLRYGQQRIPYQGFPNQYMDMTGNHAEFVNVAYSRDTSWAKLDFGAYWQDTRHEMGFFSPERTGTMPMNTHGKDTGYTVSAELPAQDNAAKWRFGHEFHHQSLDDWWPPVAGSMMMGPSDYVNINDGRRDRLAFYVEREGRLGSGIKAILGVRDELVQTDAGSVKPYGNSMMQAADVAAASAFNARDRARTDNNVDLSAILRFEQDALSAYDIGFARKSRAPSLYERYAWGRGTMAMTMTNWAGDANGYVGDVDLKPEVANTVSATADWHAPEASGWQLSLTPYFSYVQNFIDADVIGSFSPYGLSTAKGSLLRYANHDAILYGANLSGRTALWESARFGLYELHATASYTHGERTDGGNLYRIAPLVVSMAIENRNGPWTQVLETRFVAGKKAVDTQRLEPETAAYTLVNLRSQYRWSERLTISAGVSNLFDKAYADPMGGVYLTGLKAQGTGPLAALPGYGRSVDLGVSLRF